MSGVKPDANPFAGLDKALLRPTKPRSAPPGDVASPSGPTPDRAPSVSDGRTHVRSDARPNGRTVARDTTRYAFEFYRDQIERLRRISLEDKLRGGKRGMSEMVRDAVDAYLAELDRAPADRTDEPPTGRTAARPSGN